MNMLLKTLSCIFFLSVLALLIATIASPTMFKHFNFRIGDVGVYVSSNFLCVLLAMMGILCIIVNQHVVILKPPPLEQQSRILITSKKNSKGWSVVDVNVLGGEEEDGQKRSGYQNGED